MKITQEQIRKIAQHIATTTFTTLISATDIDRTTAMLAATDAGNGAAQALSLTLREHDVTITTE